MELMDFSIQYLDSYKGEQISIMKQNQEIKWVSHQQLLNKRFRDISRNSKKHINKDFHQKRELWKDGRNIKRRNKRRWMLRRKQKKRKNKN